MTQPMGLKRISEYIRDVESVIYPSVMSAFQFQSNMFQCGVQAGLALQAMKHGERIFKVHVARPKGVLDAIVPTIPLEHLAVIVAPTYEGSVL
jgi:hypothetical protein